MKLTRVLSLLLALLMCVSLFAACTKEDPTPAPDGQSSSNATPAKSEDLKIVVQSQTKYVIVRNYRASEDVIKAVNSIVIAFRDYLGVEIKVKECFNDRPDPADVVQEKEILVGATNRPESRVLELLRSEDYIVRATGDKLVVGGGTDAGTLKAATDLLTNIIYKQGNKFEVSSGTLQNLTFSNKKDDSRNIYGQIINAGKYSYSKCEIMNARIDSFNIYHPKADAPSVANTLRDYISKETGYQEYESSANGTDGAIDAVPKDILVCDWHYEKTPTVYPSVDIYHKKGFEMLISPWRVRHNTDQFINYAIEHDKGHIAGILLTTWCGSGDLARHMLYGESGKWLHTEEIARMVRHIFEEE